MTERELRKLAEKELYNDEVVWHLQKVTRFQTDIFGVFDMIFINRDSGLSTYIQITTTPNLAARRRKIVLWLMKHYLFNFRSGWVWAYNVSKKSWVKELVFLERPDEA
jgi:hypothetical protein